MAKQLAGQPGSTEQKVESLILHAFSRPAHADEVQALAGFYSAQLARFEAGELNPVSTGGEGAGASRAAWTLTVRAVLNTDEFVTKS